MAQADIESVLRERRIFHPKPAFSRQAHIKSFKQYRQLYQKAAKNPLQKTPVQQSKTESRVASTLSGKSTGKRLDLGQAAAATVPYQGNQSGTRQI